MPDIEQLWARLASFESKLDMNDQRLRSEMRDGFNRLGSQFSGQNQVIVGRVEDQERRVMLLEEQRRVNKEQREHVEKERDKRSSVLGAVMGAGSGLLAEVLRSWLAK